MAKLKFNVKRRVKAINSIVDDVFKEADERLKTIQAANFDAVAEAAVPRIVKDYVASMEKGTVSSMNKKFVDEMFAKVGRITAEMSGDDFSRMKEEDKKFSNEIDALIASYKKARVGLPWYTYDKATVKNSKTFSMQKSYLGSLNEKNFRHTVEHPKGKTMLVPFAESIRREIHLAEPQEDRFGSWYSEDDLERRKKAIVSCFAHELEQVKLAVNRHKVINAVSKAVQGMIYVEQLSDFDSGWQKYEDMLIAQYASEEVKKNPLTVSPGEVMSLINCAKESKEVCK